MEKAKVSIYKDVFENSKINILSGEEEGYKEFIDCINQVSNKTQINSENVKQLIISMGGSSTQLVYGTPGLILNHKSPGLKNMKNLSFKCGKNHYRENQIELAITGMQEIKDAIMAIDFKPDDELYVILGGNFVHVQKDSEDNSSIVEMDKIRENTRANPNQFIENIMEPLKQAIKDLYNKCSSIKIQIQEAQWAKGMAVESSPISIVDIGSSKCREWLHKSGEEVIIKSSAPSITLVIPETKLIEYKDDIDNQAKEKQIEFEQTRDIAKFQLNLIHKRFKEWNDNKTDYYATEGVREFCVKNKIELQQSEGKQFVTLNQLLECKTHPLNSYIE